MAVDLQLQQMMIERGPHLSVQAIEVALLVVTSMPANDERDVTVRRLVTLREAAKREAANTSLPTGDAFWRGAMLGLVVGVNAMALLAWVF